VYVKSLKKKSNSRNPSKNNVSPQQELLSQSDKEKKMKR